MTVGSSPYHAIKALYCRGPQADLLSITGRSANQVTGHWDELRHLMRDAPHHSTTLPSGIVVKTTTIDTTTIKDFDEGVHVIRELQKPNTAHHVGLISCILQGDKKHESAFQEWLEVFILLETSLVPTVNQSHPNNVNTPCVTMAITTLFEDTLRNIPFNDEWNVGRNIFTRQVTEFVARGEPIQMALPAFPCKSPNNRKVHRTAPDMAERIALQTLQTFVQDLRAIYPPGATMWIISDGHVFSDCSKCSASSSMTFANPFKSVSMMS
jgi:hypothetical protein